MGASKTSIYFPNKKVSHKLDWLIEKADGQAFLQSVHTEQAAHRPRCQCQPETTAQAELVIRRRDARYHIARMPNSGQLHVRGSCDLFAEDLSVSGAGEYQSAIVYDDDGADIRINFPLHRSTQAQAPTPAGRAHPKTGRVKRGTMGLGGLLSQLWTDADLNNWTPTTQRPWSRSYSSLLDAASAIRFGARRLGDFLHVQPEVQRPWLPQAIPGSAEWDHYALVLFKVSDVVPTPFHGAYLKSNKGGALLAKEPVLKAMQRSHPRAWRLTDKAVRQGLGSNQPKLFCLALVQWEIINKVPGLSIIQASVMMTNWRDIPVESTHELQVADLLVEQGRRFSKPMRFDAAEDVVFPDFLLNDAGTAAVPMEVYGVSGNAKYEERKQIKRAHYLSSGEAFWEWTPNAPLPGFPAKFVMT